MKRTLSALMMAAGVLSSACVAEREEPEAVVAMAATAKPPQFVVVSFDGSYDLDMWTKTRGYASASNAKITYYVSGVYFLPNEAKWRRLYGAPQQQRGNSLIGYADSVDDVVSRIDAMNAAIADGHEIGSHVNGHFDGTAWSQTEWKSEMDQFESFVFGRFVDKVPEATEAEKAALTAGFARLRLRPEDVAGIRAPFLGTGPGFFGEVARRKLAYDTSVTRAADYWPRKVFTGATKGDGSRPGYWDLSLAALRVPAGQPNAGKAVNSSDVGFYELQRGGKLTNPQKRDEMIATYRAQFDARYAGNRAPLRIAHHFTQYWKDKAGDTGVTAPYLDALETFMKDVCTMPDVKCVTAKELVAFLEKHAAEIPSYQKGDFGGDGTGTRTLRATSDGDTSEPVALDAPAHEACGDHH